MFSFWKKKRAREEDIIVSFDEVLITVRRPDGGMEQVRWDRLQAVIVEIGAGGAMVADMVWTLAGDDGTGCVYPGGATGENEMLAAMRERLPDFNEEQLCALMEGTQAQEALIWLRADRNH